jgi:hypothetical protein
MMEHCAGDRGFLCFIAQQLRVCKYGAADLKIRLISAHRDDRGTAVIRYRNQPEITLSARPSPFG